MKHKLSKLIKLLILGISLMALASCQDEIEPEIEIDMDGIIADDPVAKSIVAVSTKDGSEDNIIDGSSCTTVIFPITGIFEAEERVFETLDEVEALGERALEVTWLFPLRVILFDHSEISLNSEEALEAIQDSCIDGGSDSANECIDFIYPFSIQFFNTRTERVGSRDINSDREAYTTFISPDLITTIEYPIGMNEVTGNTLEAFTNEELTSIISNVENSCDEQDDGSSKPTITIRFIGNTSAINVPSGRVESNTLQFTSGTIRLEQIQFKAETDEGGSFEVDLEQVVAIDFATGATTPELSHLVFPIGTYAEVEIELELQDEDNTPSVVIEGTFTDANDQVHPIRFEFNSDETFDVEKEGRIVFGAGANVLVEVTFDPSFWFSGVTREQLSAATKNNDGVILISETSNTEIFDIVVDGLELASEIEIML
ncbi:MAG: hypothetical protein RIA69_15525 [Cyclobacteriaceae bacterium]